MLKIIFYILLGNVLGLFLGIFPALHPNNIIPLLINLIDNYLLLSILIITISLMFSFSSFLSAIILGIPEADTFLSVDPGRKLIEKGEAYKAIMLTVYGSLFGAIFSIIFVPLLYLYSYNIYKVSIKILPIVLALVSVFIIVKEENKIKALIYFVLSGILGYLSLNLNIPSYEKLTPLFTGLFGLPYLIMSLFREREVKQKEEFEIKERIILPSFLGTVASLIIIFFPSLTPSHGILLLSPLFKLSTEEFLVSLGSLTTSDQIFSFISLLTFGNPRSGSSFYLKQLKFKDRLLFFATLFISIPIIFYFMKYFTKIFIKLKIDKKVKTFLLLFVILLIFKISSFQGLIVLLASTSLGILSLKEKISRNVLTGSIIVPLLTDLLF